jgi:hypothetical protein
VGGVTVAQQTDVRSMYPDRRARRVPRPLGWRALLAAVTVAAAMPAGLWVLSRPSVGAVVVTAVVADAVVRRAPCLSLRARLSRTRDEHR